MEISSAPVGKISRTFKTTITWRMTTNFAAGLNDPNPCYFDEEREAGLIAPPMLATSLTWPISSNIIDNWGTDFDPVIFHRQVHFIEHLRWHRIMRPGNNLEIRGELASIGPCRGGSLVVVKYSAFDLNANLIFEEFCGGLLRGIRCPGGLKTSCEPPKLLEVVDNTRPDWKHTIFLDKLAPYVYDSCANTPFPIHTSPRFAKSVGLPGNIIHGTHTLTLAVREIINREANGDPRCLHAVNCCFSGMVFPGTPITIQVLEKRASDSTLLIFFEVLNAEGKRAISDAYAIIGDLLP